MTGIEKYNSPVKVQRIGNDSVYGTGADGNVTIASNISLSRDMYYNNLTVNSGSHLNTNGYKVFIKGTLTINGSIGVDSGVAVSDATLKGTSNIASNTSASIGGNAAGVTYTASQAPSYLVSAIENVISGGYVNTSGVFNPISGGAGGENGVAGTVTPATAGSGATAGGSGALNRNALAPGGPGTAGTNGAAGTTPPAAAAGSGARGGAVVLICAKTISGTGIIMARGSSATAGGASATGTGATNGAAGTAAPNANLAHYTNSHLAYRTGDGTHGPHAHVSAPALPSSPVPAAQSDHAHGYWIHTTHGGTPAVAPNSHSGHSPTYPGPTSTTYATAGPVSSYFHQNSIDHTAGGHLGHNGSVAHDFTHTSSAVGSYSYSEADHHHYVDAKNNHVCCTAAHRHRNDQWGVHVVGVYRQAGGQRSVGHNNFLGGTAGSAGTNGTNGSTTAGTDGKSGGGGGIIIVTDTSSLPCQTSVIGGTIGGVSGSSGSVITIINT